MPLVHHSSDDGIEDDDISIETKEQEDEDVRIGTENAES
jgi:hypothetical protein